MRPWYPTCLKRSMFLVAAVGVVAFSSVALMLHGLHTAPEGYEDAKGFHIVPPRPRCSGASVLPRRAKSEALNVPVAIGASLKP